MKNLLKKDLLIEISALELCVRELKRYVKVGHDDFAHTAIDTICTKADWIHNKVTAWHFAEPEPLTSVTTKKYNKVAKAINEFLDANDKALRGDAKVMPTSEWKAKGEDYGEGSVAVLIIDGSPLYEAFNYGTYGWGIFTKFQDLIGSLGYRMEAMYAWAIAIYEK